jgi:hypothetical protein
VPDRSDRSTAKYQSVTARYKSRRSVDDIRRCRRMIPVEEHERDRLEWMIAALHRDFRPRVSVPLMSAGPGRGSRQRSPGETRQPSGPPVLSIHRDPPRAPGR